MKVGIIGGAGNMGKWFARHLAGEGVAVTISGRNQEKIRRTAAELGVAYASNIDVAKTSDVIVISVLPSVFESVVAEIAPLVSEEQIVLDVTSVKTEPVDLMHRYLKKGTILGTHPVFGPGAKSLANHNVVLTPTSEKEQQLSDRVQRYLESQGASVTVMTPGDHDEMMTVVLALAHFIAITAADTLLEYNHLATMQRVGGTTFKLLYTLVESVISEDPGLYASLQMCFPGAARVEAKFIENALSWKEMVQSKNATGFAEKMQRLRDKLEETDPSFRRAYENMYRINEILNS